MFLKGKRKGLKPPKSLGIKDMANGQIKPHNVRVIIYLSPYLCRILQIFTRLLSLSGLNPVTAKWKQ